MDEINEIKAIKVIKLFEYTARSDDVKVLKTR